MTDALLQRSATTSNRLKLLTARSDPEPLAA